jgi:hypothetical protein
MREPELTTWKIVPQKRYGRILHSVFLVIHPVTKSFLASLLPSLFSNGYSQLSSQYRRFRLMKSISMIAPISTLPS